MDKLFLLVLFACAAVSFVVGGAVNPDDVPCYEHMMSLNIFDADGKIKDLSVSPPTNIFCIPDYGELC